MEIMGHLQEIINIACRNKALSPDLEQLCTTIVPPNLNSALNMLPAIKDALEPQKKKNGKGKTVIILLAIVIVILLIVGVYLTVVRGQRR
jgi:hypothetical protein